MTVPQALRLTEPIHTHGSRSDSFAPNGAKPQIRIPYRPTNRLLAPFAFQPTILSDPRLFVHGCAQQTVSFRTQPLEPKSCVNHHFSLHSIVSNGLSNRTGCSHPTAHPQRCRTHLHVYRPLADMVVEPYGFGIHARFSRFVPPRRRQRTDHRASHRLARPCSIFRV